MQHEAKSVLPETSQWQTWTGGATPGYFFTGDLLSARRQLMDGGRSPKVGMFNGHIISLSYRCTQAKDGCKGTMVLRQSIEHEDAIRAWLARLPREVEWNAERLPGLTQKVLCELWKAERRKCPEAVRNAVLQEQGDRCAICGGCWDGDPPEWDHKSPLQGLCA